MWLRRIITIQNHSGIGLSYWPCSDDGGSRAGGGGGEAGGSQGHQRVSQGRAGVTQGQGRWVVGQPGPRRGIVQGQRMSFVSGQHRATVGAISGHFMSHGVTHWIPQNVLGHEASEKVTSWHPGTCRDSTTPQQVMLRRGKVCKIRGVCGS